MKNIKRISLLFVFVVILSFALPFTAFAHDNIKPIEDNDKIFAYVPWEYELSGFSDNLSYSDEDGNSISFCVGENKFAPNGITALNDWQVQTVFEHFYLYAGDLERQNECVVEYKETRKENINGYSAYYLSGNYSYSEEDIGTDWAYYFNALVFATKENIFVVGYEDISEKTENFGDLLTSVSGIVFNGTPFDGEMPERNRDHDFSASPAFEDVVIASQVPFFEDGVLGIATGIVVIMTVVPTLIVIIIAIVLIKKYNKVKKKLRQYRLSYGLVPKYNTYSQNYGGYGYNPPINQPYQPTVNPVYQQNPVNQNTQQTPSYVTNAVENLEKTQPTQPAQTNLPPEMQENKIDNENKF